MLTDAEINERVGVLLRREIEARILAPIIEAFSAELGRERTLEIVARVIAEIAQKQGREVAERVGGRSIADLARAMEPWWRGGALQQEVLAQTAERYDFNVTRCQYAEMYRRLGIPELGAILSCTRDWAFVEGFNPEIRLERSQTIMQGAPCCDFRYRAGSEPSAE